MNACFAAGGTGAARAATLATAAGVPAAGATAAGAEAAGGAAAADFPAALPLAGSGSAAAVALLIVLLVIMQDRYGQELAIFGGLTQQQEEQVVLQRRRRQGLPLQAEEEQRYRSQRQQLGEQAVPEQFHSRRQQRALEEVPGLCRWQRAAARQPEQEHRPLPAEVEGRYRWQLDQQRLELEVLVELCRCFKTVSPYGITMNSVEEDLRRRRWWRSSCVSGSRWRWCSIRS